MDLFYNENGWVFEKNILDQSEINTILKLIDNYILKHNDKMNIWDINKTEDGKINSIHCLHIYDNTLLDFFKKKKKIIEIVKNLLKDEVEIIAIEAFLKPANTGKKVVVHQDNYLWCLENDNALTVWIALDEIDETNGGLRYYSKSHKLGLLDHEPSYKLGTSQTIKQKEFHKFNKCEKVINKLSPGDIQIHSALTIHDSKENISNKPRRVITVQFKSVNNKLDIERRKKYREEVIRQQNILKKSNKYT